MCSSGAICAALSFLLSTLLVATCPANIPKASPSESARISLPASTSGSGIDELLRNDRAILLENEFIDSSLPLPERWPEELRDTHPSAFVVQAPGPITEGFRNVIAAHGGRIICYVPNNSLLVRGEVSFAESVTNASAVQAIVPLQPAHKLSAALLRSWLAGQRLAPGIRLHILLFPADAESGRAAVTTAGARVLDESPSPFGPVLSVTLGSADLSALARLDAVQRIEPAHRRMLATDLSREQLGAGATQSETNYLGLTGTNVLVAVLDTGVDASHPALTNRVVGTPASALSDTNGHGTVVAGVIAGNGAASETIASVPGSPMPGTQTQFRGLAPSATILSSPLDAGTAAPAPQSQIEAIALAGATIVNQSWVYESPNSYDLSSSIYDAAVRDAVPALTGPSPLSIVVAAGNLGAGQDSGLGGISGTVQSPATAKNVITVGALEHLRSITNEVWSCSTNEPVVCTTNQPWLPGTDSSNRVAAFSARGNVGIGVESGFGRFKPDLVAPGSFLVAPRSTTQSLPLTLETDRALTPFPGTNNYSDAFQELNQPLAPHYRFESGTSVAAANVAGLLALLEEFFRERVGWTNSPALLKAILINGARSLGEPYDFASLQSTNLQGWGQPSLTHSAVPGTTNGGSAPVLAFDQAPAAALRTGDYATRVISLADSARSEPLRLTLVWTDPPANPLVAAKLVNDLDLVVTNLDNGEVFLGNQFAPGSCFSQAAADPETAGDCVNNVENIFLEPPLSTNYSVTVRARAVNANAVAAQSGKVAQDYALVLSSDDHLVPDAITLLDSFMLESSPVVSALTNAFDIADGEYGQILVNQRIGAHTPLADVPVGGGAGEAVATGDTNQWRFYTITNEPGFSYAAFACFNASEIALATGSPSPRPAADLDLYVSRDPGLLQLNPTSLLEADSSVTRGGTEAILLPNAGPEVFYIAVKCESSYGAEFGLAAIFSATPFSETDGEGNAVLRTFPRAVPVPDHNGLSPGKALQLALNPDPLIARRVAVTNEVVHERLSDLVLSLTHNGRSAVLLNHSTNPAPDGSYVFDDTGELNDPGARPSEGPGSLLDFQAAPSNGLWLLASQDDLPGSVGTNQNARVLLEVQKPLTNGVSFALLPGYCREEFVTVPEGSTNLVFQVSLVTTGQVEVAARRLDEPPELTYTNAFSGPGSLTFVFRDIYSHPPLSPGRYSIRVCNASQESATVEINAFMSVASEAEPALTSTLDLGLGSLSIQDDALTIAGLSVNNTGILQSVEVGLWIEHPRLSDLAVALVSPSGTRVRLIENRGGPYTNGLGQIVTVTNEVPVSSAGGPLASTNVLDTAQNQGTISIDYDFYTLPDTLRVYYETNRLVDTGLVSGSGITNIAYGPGETNAVVIVINEGDNFDEDTFWHYVASWSHPAPALATFTDDTRLTQTPIKFAIPPFTNATYIGPELTVTNQFVYLPEEPLARFAGEPVEGQWRLEILDSRSGGNDPPAILRKWQVKFTLQQSVPVPVPLMHGQPVTLTIPPGAVQSFSVLVPDWALFATNALLSSTAPLDLYFNPQQPPTGANPLDVLWAQGATSASVLLASNTTPPLNAGGGYYLSLINTNPAPVLISFSLAFDITPLEEGVALATQIDSARDVRYFSFEVSSNTTALSIQVLQPGVDLSLAASPGLPVPDLETAMFVSALPGTNSEAINLFSDFLVPGTWHIGVFDHGATNTVFTIEVVQYTNAVPEITTLMSGSPHSGLNSGEGSATDYYRFVVSTNADRAQFEISMSTADMMLVASKNLPLPDADSYQFRSDNPWTNTELIVIFPTSTPIPLTPGEWFLGAVNLSEAEVEYTIKATEFDTPGSPFAIIRTEVVSNTLCLTWTSLPGAYYVVEGTPDFSPAVWTPVSPTVLAENAETTWCVELPSTNHFFRVREGTLPGPVIPEPAPVQVELLTNSVLLTWRGPISSVFAVQWSPCLDNPKWESFPAQVTSTNTFFRFQEPCTNGAKYFRILLSDHGFSSPQQRTSCSRTLVF